MSIITAVHHITHYQYDKPINLGPQIIRLRPAPHTRSAIHSYSLKIHPVEHFINWQQDPFGNYLARLIFPNKTQEFKVEVDLLTEIRVFNPFDFFLDEKSQRYPFKYDDETRGELAPYLVITEAGPKLKKWVKELSKISLPSVDFLSLCNQKLSDALEYVIRLEPGIQSCEETLTLKKGSCRDMAWLLCQLLRHLGLASRFCSGYLIQLKQDIPSIDGPSGAAEDFTDLHAWTEVYLPGAGWVGLDPTSGLFAGEGHIPLSCSPNPSTAAPVTGSLEECESRLIHEMSVRRIQEAPRITRPFSDESWSRIDALGEQVDRDLAASDVRLTMGGEPTFVSLDDPQGEEWNYTALSPAKTVLGDHLLWRLKSKIAPGALILYTQGKWYPNEPLPRWAMHCVYRKDGTPIWEDDSLLARTEDSLGHSLPIAKTFLTDLAEVLGIPPSYVLGAHEDAPYYLWKERLLPREGQYYDANLYDKKERERLQRLLENNLNDPVGYVLPLHYSLTWGHWISNSWKFRGKRLVLTPGDSPIGLRLPLGSLSATSAYPPDMVFERSPLERVKSLPEKEEFQQRVADNSSTICYHQEPGETIRTALCAEIREGKLHLFLPPFGYVEHFLELIAAIEFVAAKHRTPVVLEGYPPPRDHRIEQFSVTPDPGVLEVNMPPAKSWQELKTLTSTLYEEARASRLVTEKFLLDGRLVGTGGGNHIVVGGAHPTDSPFLRRPDLLRSLITFWQHHPSLSYLFSAQYIGPTSQAPRIDEARHDALYELEIAFRQIPKDREVPLWLVDRLFRHLLVDLTGNTHRAEFCIDKLYNPDSDRGRLGLLELRGFEMTPHHRMNLLQALLVRASIVSFWNRPYHHDLIPWGTLLHDKYMLPQYVWEDFLSALTVLNQSGYAFEPEWFQPFMEFRFPKLGTVQHGGVTLELRYALEPWPILGEEIFQGGTSRAVDSSVERVQVKVQGFIEERHTITCNGRPLQLQPTSQRGVYAAGVRYKAWGPASSLHPTIPVHSPLIFDIYDRAHQRSLGGCKYHVMHQGGRAYSTYPVNANEAEGRRLSRFEPMGHSPGIFILEKGGSHPDFPYTMDLRQLR